MIYDNLYYDTNGSKGIKDTFLYGTGKDVILALK